MVILGGMAVSYERGTPVPLQTRLRHFKQSLAMPPVGRLPDYCQVDMFGVRYRGILLIRKCPPPGPYSTMIPRALW